MTTLLRVEHPVIDFNAWRSSFERYDDLRQQHGVHQYTILRPVDDPHYVVIDVELGSRTHAEMLLAALQRVWGDVAGKVLPTDVRPRARILDRVGVKRYAICPSGTLAEADDDV
jgi:hypothetical protein